MEALASPLGAWLLFAVVRRFWLLLAVVALLRCWHECGSLLVRCFTVGTKTCGSLPRHAVLHPDEQLEPILFTPQGDALTPTRPLG